MKSAAAIRLVAGVVLGILAPASLWGQQAEKEARPESWRVYVGTYTRGGSKGIYVLEMDARTGKLTPPRLAVETRDPSFLAIHPGGKYLHAVNEISTFDGKKTGSVSAFAIDPEKGQLTLLNSQPSGGTGPCHLVISPKGDTALVANYGGGSVASLPIASDGKLEPPASVIQHEGSGVNPARQKGPHAHSINLDPAGKRAYAADLGLDKILIYRFDAEDSTLTPNDPPFARVAPGAGPRHLAFHPSGKLVYVINEMHSTVTGFRHDPESGALKQIQTISTLPAPRTNNSTAEVVVHPSGRFLYGSNRGHNSIAIFTIDQETGKLTAAGHQTHEVNVPRNFVVDPLGTFLIVASQAGNKLVVFRIDPETGQLAPTGETANIASPVCVRMIPAPGK